MSNEFKDLNFSALSSKQSDFPKNVSNNQISSDFIYKPLIIKGDYIKKTIIKKQQSLTTERDNVDSSQTIYKNIDPPEMITSKNFNDSLPCYKITKEGVSSNVGNHLFKIIGKHFFKDIQDSPSLLKFNHLFAFPLEISFYDNKENVPNSFSAEISYLGHYKSLVQFVSKANSQELIQLLYEISKELNNLQKSESSQFLKLSLLNLLIDENNHPKFLIYPNFIFNNLPGMNDICYQSFDSMIKIMEKNIGISYSNIFIWIFLQSIFPLQKLNKAFQKIKKARSLESFIQEIEGYFLNNNNLKLGINFYKTIFYDPLKTKFNHLLTIDEIMSKLKALINENNITPKETNLNCKYRLNIIPFVHIKEEATKQNKNNSVIERNYSISNCNLPSLDVSTNAQNFQNFDKNIDVLNQNQKNISRGLKKQQNDKLLVSSSIGDINLNIQNDLGKEINKILIALWQEIYKTVLNKYDLIELKKLISSSTQKIHYALIKWNKEYYEQLLLNLFSKRNILYKEMLSQDKIFYQINDLLSTVPKFQKLDLNVKKNLIYPIKIQNNIINDHNKFYCNENMILFEIERIYSEIKKFDPILKAEINNTNNKVNEKLNKKVQINSLLEDRIHLDKVYKMIKLIRLLLINQYDRVNMINKGGADLLEENYFSIDLEYFKSKDKLEFLMLNKAQFSSEQYKFFLNVLEQNNDIQALNLTNCNLDPLQFNSLFITLEKIPKINYLNISNNNLNEKNSIILSNAMLSLKQLHTISLDNCKLNDLIFSSIIGSLKNHEKIRRISFSENDISNLLINNLQVKDLKNMNLTHLDFSHNKFTSECAKRIINTLNQNNTLQYLRFGSNKIDTTGLKDILFDLKSNKSLKELDISNLNLSDETVENLVDFIKAIISMKRLNISNNKISEAKINDIKSELQKKEYLCWIKHDRNQSFK